jgi:DNA repair protein RadA
LKADKDVATKSQRHFTTAGEHYVNRRSTIERLSTGSRNIDDILYGGVETRAVTEFYGAAGSGKTQVCYTMCAIVPQDKSKGGVCGKSIYIDTEGTFMTERIAVISKARGFDPRKTVNNVMIEQVTNSGEQEEVIDKIDFLLKNNDSTERFKLLVVDSLVTHYRVEYIGRAMLPERQQKLYKFMCRQHIFISSLLTIIFFNNIALQFVAALGPLFLIEILFTR